MTSFLLILTLLMGWRMFTTSLRKNYSQTSLAIWTNTPNSSIILKEVAEWEHSEPGTGSPPTPAEKPIEKDAKEGWRRDTPPIVEELEE